MNTSFNRSALGKGDLVSIRNRYLRSPNAILEGIHPEDFNGERQWYVRLCKEGRVIIVLEHTIQAAR